MCSVANWMFDTYKFKIVSLLVTYKKPGYRFVYKILRQHRINDSIDSKYAYYYYLKQDFMSRINLNLVNWKSRKQLYSKQCYCSLLQQGKILYLMLNCITFDKIYYKYIIN